MTQLDVSQLKTESLSEDSFPASRQSPFRLFFDPEVHAAIQAHATEDVSVEICGVLVGLWYRDEDGPYAKVTASIRCDSATSKFAEVTFTHESWAQINAEMDSKYSDLRIIGWYHTHPDFGIFLSDRDVFIHQNFFSGPGQIALVVDPVRKTEGVFEWRGGKPELMSQFWIGDRIETIAASKSPAQASRPAVQSAQQPVAVSETSNATPAETTLDLVTRMLSWLCLFLVGYLLAGWRSSTEISMLKQGAVAQYGVFNLMAYGREDITAQTHELVKSAEAEVQELSIAHARLVKDKAENETLKKRWTEVRTKLNQSTRLLAAMEKQYAVSKEEKELQSLIVAQTIAALSGVKDSKATIAEPKPPVGGNPEPRPSQNTKNKSGPAKKNTDSKKKSVGAAGPPKPKQEEN